MQEGRVDAVLMWHVDRLVRQPRELENLITIADDAGVTFNAVRAGDIDLSTASGRLVARLLGAVARHEIELKSERQVAQKRQAARAGVPNAGGVRPFGWLNDRRTIHPDEAPIVAQIAEKILAGESIVGCIGWLHDKHVQTPSGAERWHHITVRRMLLNPRLAGHATYQGEIVGTGQWEPILDDDTWRRVVARIEQNRGNRQASNVRVALFSSSMIVCGKCGYALLTNSRPSIPSAPDASLRVYACREKYIGGRAGYRKSCGSLSIRAEPLEDDVASRVLARISQHRNQPMLDAALTQKARAGDGETRVSDLTALEGQLRQTGVDYADGLLGRTEFLAVRDRLAERIEEARGQLIVDDTPDVPGTTPDELAAWWEAATLAQRQALMHGQVRSVTVGPHQWGSPVYDPDRVTVEWR